jgi:ATP-dependent Clp protease ATP-binding subunit ClpA
LKRTLQKMIEDPLAEEILQGRFSSGSEVRVSKKGDSLNFVDAGVTQSVDEEMLDQDKA